jgi:hypothetical protein
MAEAWRLGLMTVRSQPAPGPKMANNPGGQYPHLITAVARVFTSDEISPLYAHGKFPPDVWPAGIRR